MIESETDKSDFFDKISKNPYSPYVFLTAIILFQISWHVFLWINNQNALTTDEYLRLYFSASWAKMPKLFIPGEFLPFYFYIYGSAINILGNIVWSARIVTLIFSLLFTVYFYRLSLHFFKEKLAGIMVLTLVVSSHLFMKISTVPLSETAAIALISISLFYLLEWHENLKTKSQSNRILLLLSMLPLFIANGLRYECWIITAFSAIFICYALIKYRVKSRAFIISIVILLIPVCLPPAWLYIEYFTFGVATKFIPGVKSSSVKFSNLYLYPKLLFAYYPILLFVGIFCLSAIKILFKNIKNISLTILSIIFFIFLIFISFKFASRHIVLPERTLLFFVFLFAPIAVLSFKDFADKHLRIKKPLYLIFALAIIFNFALSFIKFTEIKRNPEPLAKEVATYINNLKAKGKISEETKFLLEKTGRDWHVMYVESNLMDKVFFDRPSIIGKKMTEMPSMLFSTKGDELRNTIRESKIAYLVFKNPSLKTIIRENLNVKEETKIGQYTIFLIN